VFTKSICIIVLVEDCGVKLKEAVIFWLLDPLLVFEVVIEVAPIGAVHDALLYVHHLYSQASPLYKVGFPPEMLNICPEVGFVM